MKKITAFLLLMFSIVLVSCNNNNRDANVVRKDMPSAEMITELKLDLVSSGENLNSVDQTQAEYYVVKAATDAASTIFVYSTSLDEALKNHSESMNYLSVQPLTFTGEITTNEAANIANIVSTNVTKEKVGLSFDINVPNSWDTIVNDEMASKAISDYNSGVTNIYISIIYMPVYVEHYENSTLSLGAYAVMPLYYEITTINNNQISSSNFDNIPVKTLSFDESNLLQSAEQ